MKRFCLLGLFACFALSAMNAQNSFEEYYKKRNKQFAAYKAERNKKFEEYRRERNRKFAEYIEKRWEAFQIYKGVSRPIEPKPKDPIVADKPAPPHSEQLPIKGVVPVSPKPIQKKPSDLPPIKKIEPNNQAGKTKLRFLNTDCYIRLQPSLKFTLKSISEKEVASTIRSLSEGKYDELFYDCAQIYQKLNLNGWATYLLTKEIAERIQGKQTSETALLQNMLLTYLGYDARLCQVNNRLYLLLPTNEVIAKCLFITIDGRKYHIMDCTAQSASIYSYRKNMDYATNTIDFDRAEEMNLPYHKSNGFLVKSERYPEMQATIGVNTNLIDFYKTIPVLANDPWGMYARQNLENPVYQQLATQLFPYVQGKDEYLGASMLLDWIQTGFQYQTDDEQFGFEKPFFKEEIFYYPYCDCEDRSILFSYLVHKLLGLNVVLVYVPGHIFAAVEFNKDVKGDYLMYRNKKYVVCDPTYISASVGRMMPRYKNVKTNIVEIGFK